MMRKSTPPVYSEPACRRTVPATMGKQAILSSGRVSWLAAGLAVLAGLCSGCEPPVPCDDNVPCSGSDYEDAGNSTFGLAPA